MIRSPRDLVGLPRRNRRLDEIIQVGGARSVGGDKTSVGRFKIRSVATTYLLCVEWDGEDEGDEVLVARPWMLRPMESRGDYEYGNYEDDGQERVSTNEDDEEETQTVTPTYLVTDEIYAVKCDTGVVVEHVVVNGQSLNDVTVEWLDLNVDGRCWAQYDAD